MTNSGGGIYVRPITTDDIENVADFLQNGMGSRLSARQWADAMVAPWSDGSPNYGFMLVSDDGIVGANLAFYSVRAVNGVEERFCNLGALCVRESARPHAVRLIRAILGQRGYHFTDLSPSGNVVEVDRRLGFRELDTATALTANMPWWTGDGVRLVSDPGEIEQLLMGEDRRIFLDHKGALAARHLLVTRGTEQCYIVFRKDRRKRLRIFASILYVSNKSLYREAARQIGGHLLGRHGTLACLAELRIIGAKPPRAYMLKKPRPKMYKSKRLSEAEVDYLYSELTCVPW